MGVATPLKKLLESEFRTREAKLSPTAMREPSSDCTRHDRTRVFDALNYIPLSPRLGADPVPRHPAASSVARLSEAKVAKRVRKVVPGVNYRYAVWPEDEVTRPVVRDGTALQVVHGYV